MKSTITVLGLALIGMIIFGINSGFGWVTERWGPLASLGLIVTIGVLIFTMAIMGMLMAYTSVILKVQANVFVEKAATTEFLYKLLIQLIKFAGKGSVGRSPDEPIDPAAWVVDARPTGLPGQYDASQPALPWPDDYPEAGRVEQKKSSKLLVAR